MRPGQDWAWRLGKAQADLGVFLCGEAQLQLCLEAPPYSPHFLTGPPKTILSTLICARLRPGLGPALRELTLAGRESL